ncbi:stage II sporulation protein M [Pseudomonadota bacterium]
MKQEQFIRLYEKEWQKLETQVEQLESRKNSHKESLKNFPQTYRRVCQYLAMAKTRCYSNQLVIHLNSLVLRGHQHLYRQRSRLLALILEYLFSDFPRLVRRERKMIFVAILLFLGPLIGTALLVISDENLIYNILSPSQVVAVENMYDPEKKFALGKERESDTDVLMFGYYIQNNIGIAFRMFAGGIIFGIGSVFFLLFNGFHIGAISGLMVNLEFYETFFPFVIGHGSFELTALVFAGAAGLRLGASLISPGQFSRLVSLRLGAHEAVRLMYGATVMLVAAAFIEAFWSSSIGIPMGVKYTVGAILWTLVISYFLFAGRHYEA